MTHDQALAKLKILADPHAYVSSLGPNDREAVKLAIDALSELERCRGCVGKLKAEVHDLRVSAGWLKKTLSEERESALRAIDSVRREVRLLKGLED